MSQTVMSNQSSSTMVLAEALGAGTLVFAIIAAMSAMPMTEMHPLLIALLFSLAFIVAFYTISAVSGGHINPLVTLSMFFAGRMSFKLAALYILGQIVGGLIGLFLAMWLFSSAWTSPNLPVTDVDYMHLFKTGMVQLLVTFAFTLVFLVVTANPLLASTAGLIIAAVFGMSILAASSAGGWSGTNGLTYLYSILNGDLMSILVLALTPILGAIIAGAIYKLFTRYKGESLLVDCDGKPILDQCCKKQYKRHIPARDQCGNIIKDCDGCVQTIEVIRHDVRPTHKQETYLTILARRVEEETGIHQDGIMSKLVGAKENLRSLYVSGMQMVQDGTLTENVREKLDNLMSENSDLLDKAKERVSHVMPRSRYASRASVPEDFYEH